MAHPRVLYFSRGLGIGHATRDVAILQRLEALLPDAAVCVASYARGLPLLRAYGYEPIDLGLPPMGADNERLIRIAQLIRRQQPDLVVSDEELLALPLARLERIPALLVTNWIIDERRLREASFMRSANAIIIPDLPDAFDRPPLLDVPISYVGRLFDRFGINAVNGMSCVEKLALRRTASPSAPSRPAACPVTIRSSKPALPASNFSSAVST